MFLGGIERDQWNGMGLPMFLCQILREKCPYSEFSGPYFPAFRLNTERYRDTEYLSVFNPNAVKSDKKNSEYRHFLRSERALQECKTSKKKPKTEENEIELGSLYRKYQI